MDLHQGQIQGFFNIPVDELTAVHMLSRYFIDMQLDDLVVVTDLGFAKRARQFAELMNAPLAIVEKRRHGNLDRAEVMNVIGDVRGRRAIIVDDEIDTAGTLIEITRALEREGVTEIYACATHGVLSDPAVERIANSALREVVITDTIPLSPSRQIDKLKVLSVAPLIGEAIKRIHRGESVGALFSSEVSFTQEMLLWEDGVSGNGRTGDDSTAAATTTYHHRCPHRPAPDRPPPRRSMSLQLHRPDGKGGLEVRPVTDRNWRNQLKSSRWGASLKGGTLPELSNPEMNPTSTLRSVLFWVVLAAITFAIIVVGYTGLPFAGHRARCSTSRWPAPDRGNLTGTRGVRGEPCNEQPSSAASWASGPSSSSGLRPSPPPCSPTAAPSTRAGTPSAAFEERAIAMPAPMPVQVDPDVFIDEGKAIDVPGIVVEDR